ncbi:uncharacterized protein [Littorina saxatilis]|uniref:Uncharacterized protein n=1 Tax=Littorina saxatilis TaxID=31220 RepID=A0AAN9BUI6_9CAEN
MAMFTKRHNGYKAGLALFVIGVVVFVVGFASPNWSTTSTTLNSTIHFQSNTHNGLWMGCLSRGLRPFVIKFCASTISGSSAEWFKAAQALQCLALAGFVLSVCFAFVVNFVGNYRSFNRWLEIALGMSSFLGLIGAIVYAIKQGKGRENAEALADRFPEISTEIEHVAWAFIVDVVGCLVVLVATIVIAVFNRPIPAEASTVSFHNTMQSPGITFVPGHSYPVPAVNPGYVPDRQTNTYVTSGPSSVPYVSAGAANPPPYYSKGQPMGTENGLALPPAYANQQTMEDDDSSLGAMGGSSPPVVSDEDILVNGKRKK